MADYQPSYPAPTQHTYPPQQYPQQPGPAYGPPPAFSSGPAPRKRNPLLVAGLATLATLFVLAFGTYAIWANFIREDPGVAACKAIRDGKTMLGDDKAEGASKPMTEAEYRQARKLFEDSDKPKIREHGTALVDLAWQIQQMPGDEKLGALAFIGPMGTHVAGLQTACADEGIIINLSE